MAKLPQAELDRRREAALLDIAHIRNDPVEVVRAQIKFTCDECKNPEDCVWAYDSYNTDGDCLFLK